MCKEVDYSALWKLGAKVLERSREKDERDDNEEHRQDRMAEWLRDGPVGVDRIEKCVEYTLALAAGGRHKYALEELETLVPLFSIFEEVVASSSLDPELITP